MAETTTVAWVCETYPGRVEKLMANLDLEREGLQTVKSAVARGDFVQACEALLEYYRTGGSGQWLRTAPVTPGTERSAAADAILNDTFTFYRQTDRVPRKPGGGLLWTHPGPSNDWEWTLALNRHHHIGTLLTAYRQTGNREYANRIDAHIHDWITASLPYPAKRNATAIWRGLEVSFRAKRWAQVFYGLQHVEALTPATEILMLTSLPEHAHHLRNFHGGNNWLTMELSALAMIAAAWPEYKESAAWFEYASQQLSSELAGQVYPDGAQHELSSHYHRVALVNFEQFAAICRGAEIPVPDEFGAGLELMWNYLADTMRPDGHGLLNNDSDLDDNRPQVLAAAETYDRPDWVYIASNGEKGTAPKRGPSIMLPWAGQFVMRSGWEHDALWAFFDLGPWGAGHQHNDKLHLSVSAFERDLLVDSGRFTYAGNDARFRRDYAVLSRAHNVIMVDEKGQRDGPKIARAPIPENDFAVTSDDVVFARASCDRFDAVAGRATHTRAVVYLHGDLIVVADRIATDRPRLLETLWHWHPDCTVKLEAGSIASTDTGTGNLRIVPLADFAWDISMAKGQEQPHLQGWYSRQYNEWAPNSTAVLTANVDGTVAFAWLLLTAQGEVPQITGEIIDSTADRIRIRIQMPDKDPLMVTVPWDNGAPTAGE